MADGQSLITVPLNGRPWPTLLGEGGRRVVSVGRGGTTYAQRTTLDFADRVIGASDDTVVYISDGGTSDLIAGESAEDMATIVKTYLDARRLAGADITVLTTTPPSTLLDPGPEAERVAMNAAILNDPASFGADVVVDVAGIPELANVNDTDYYYDGTHYTQAAADLVAALIDATLSRLGL